MDYLSWNAIPTVAGKLAGGLPFVGAALFRTHDKTVPKRAPVSPAHVVARNA
ncbi:hypothetical protein [Burkholderia territorii]|uniref:hypothetical protein n=1 Tax=Burkholderia territorii TaxID=1503055 RepID=UPI000A80B437